MSRGRAWGLLGGISLLWGSQWLLGPALANAAQPFAAVALLFGASALAAALFSGLRSPARLKAPAGAAAVVALMLLAGPQILLVLAGRHGVGGWVPLLSSFLPLFLSLLAGAWSPAMAAAPACVLVLLNGTVPFAPPGKLLWAACALAAVLLQAAAFHFISEQCRGAAVGPLLAQSFAYASAALGAVSLLLDRHPRISADCEGWAALAIAGVLGAALPYAGLLLLLTRGPLAPAQAAAGPWLQLLAGAAESALLARAHVGPAVWFASAALVVCAWSVLRGDQGGEWASGHLFHENP